MKSIQGEIELFNNMAPHGLMWVFIKKQISSPVKKLSIGNIYFWVNNDFFIGLQLTRKTGI